MFSIETKWSPNNSLLSSLKCLTLLSTSKKHRHHHHPLCQQPVECYSVSPYPPLPLFFLRPPRLPPCYIPPLLRCHGNMSDCLAICSALSSRWAPFCCASECSCVCWDRNTFLHLRFLSSADAHRHLSVSECATKCCKRIMCYMKTPCLMYY